MKPRSYDDIAPLGAHHDREREEEEKAKELVIHPCPAPGDGVHYWMYGATQACRRAGVPESEIGDRLRPLMTRKEQSREIANTVATVYSTPATTRAWKREVPRSPVNSVKMGEIQLLYRDVTLHTWEELSDPCESQEAILRWAFKPSGEFVCFGLTEWKFNTVSLEAAISHAPACQFIVPNPMKARWGRTQAGKLSHKSNDQVLEQRFVVVEFDLRAFDWTTGFTRAAKLDYQARLHFHLSREFPLPLIVFSGRESAHGWYATKRPHDLMSKATSLGADPALWCPSQFTRMPLGLHANGTRQRVVYFRPSNFSPQK